MIEDGTGDKLVQAPNPRVNRSNYFGTTSAIVDAVTA